MIVKKPWCKPVRPVRGFGQLARFGKTNEKRCLFSAVCFEGRKVGWATPDGSFIYMSCEVSLGPLDSVVEYPE